MKRTVFLLALFVFAAPITAALPEAPTVSRGLGNGTWRLTRMPGQILPTDQGAPMVSFEAGRVHGFSGCNRFTGSYALEGEALTIYALATTRMLCEEPVMVQEREFVDALESATKWQVEPSMLDLHRADGERVLTAKEVSRE